VLSVSQEIDAAIRPYSHLEPAAGSQNQSMVDIREMQRYIQLLVARDIFGKTTNGGETANLSMLESSCMPAVKRI
jgi:hypothetical protein